MVFFVNGWGGEKSWLLGNFVVCFIKQRTSEKARKEGRERITNMGNKQRLFLDIDDVVLNTQETIIDLLNKRRGT